MTIIQDGVAKGKTNNEIVKTLIGMDFKVQGSDETGKIVFPPDMIFVPKNIAFNKEKSFALNVIGVGNYNVDTNEKTVNNEVAKTKEDITQRLGLCNNDNVDAVFSGKTITSVAAAAIHDRADTFVKLEQNYKQLNPNQIADYNSGKITAIDIIKQNGWQNEFKSWIQQQIDAIKEIKSAGIMKPDELQQANVASNYALAQSTDTTARAVDDAKRNVKEA